MSKSIREKALELLLDWAIVERNMSYTDGLIYIAEMEIINKENRYA